MSGFVQISLMGDISSVEEKHIEVDIGHGKFWECFFNEIHSDLQEGMGIYIRGYPLDEAHQLFVKDHYIMSSIIKNDSNIKTCYYGIDHRVMTQTEE